MKLKKIAKWTVISLLAVIFILSLGINFLIVKKNPIGFYVNKDVCGAETCGACHPHQYEEWRAGQMAAFAAVREIMEADQAAEFAGPLCWKCHDPYKQGLDEGVTCEFCHGKLGAMGCECAQEDQEMHKTERQRNLILIRDEKWCHQCHTVIQPITGADLQGTVAEWEASKAKKEGLTCQSCHMPLIGEGDQKHHFHGHYYPGRNPLPHRKSVTLETVSLDQGKLNVVVKNNVTSHYFPSGAHTKALILEVHGYQPDDTEPVFKDRYLFMKRFKFKKFLGIQELPYTVYKDTRIKPEEARTVSFDIENPMDLNKIVVTLRAGFLGDLGEEVEAWTSAVLFQKELVL
jgi:hypothetical protein